MLFHIAPSFLVISPMNKSGGPPLISLGQYIEQDRRKAEGSLLGTFGGP